MRTLIENAAIATMDAEGTEHAWGHVVLADGVIETVGAGAPPDDVVPDRRIDGSDCLVTPGLVNTHHHLYQWATRGYGQQSTLFEWLTELYPVWSHLDRDIVQAAATAGLVRLARTGCTTAADHHYVFPRAGGDVFGAVVDAGRAVGVRLHAVRGSMDRGESQGGLPPDDVVEDLDAALAGTEAAIDTFHDPAPNAMVRVAVGPCSPFSVSGELMTGAAELARRKGVRLHTHLAETVEEEAQCRAEFGCTPAEYARRLGWTGADVWLAHGIHLADDAVRHFGETQTGVAHCPTSNARLGAGVARVADLLAAGVPVGLGADGAASNEDGGLGVELRQAAYSARQRGGPAALSARQTLWMATMGGARCLGRENELGSLEPGKQADLALWALDGIEHQGIADPVAAMVFGALPTVRALLVGGEQVIADGRSTRLAEPDCARSLSALSGQLARRAGRG